MDGAGITIGVDIGTAAVKAVAASADGQVLARSRVGHELHATGAGAFEHVAQQAWIEGPLHALEEVMMQLRHAFGEEVVPAAVCVAAMAPSMCAVDGGGRPLSPGLLYGDYRGRRSAGSKQMGSVSPIPEDAYGFLASLVEEYPDAAGYWPAQAVANHALCGTAALDSFSALTFSPLHGEAGWDAGVLAGLGVPESKLPLVVPAGSAVGELGTEGELGTVGMNVLGRDAGQLGMHHTVVASGIVDALAEQMVVGRLDDGDVLVVLGSTLLIWARLPRWREVSGLWTVPDLFDLSGAGCLVGGASNAGGMFVDWVRRLVGMMPAGNGPTGGGERSAGKAGAGVPGEADRGGALGGAGATGSLVDITGLIGQSGQYEPGDGEHMMGASVGPAGIPVFTEVGANDQLEFWGASVGPAGIPVWAPYPRGERTPFHDPSRRATLGGLGLEHGPDAVMRAAYEASGFVIRRHIELAGCGPRRILATGGGIQVNGWLQAIADCTGLPVDVQCVPEGAALGAAFMARIACGLERSGALPAGWQQAFRRVEPDSRWVMHCSERYRKFLEMSA